MFRVSPLGVLVAIVVVGVTIQVVEQKSREAAYALVVLILLGIITFNADTFNTQVARILTLFNAPSKSAGGARPAKKSPTGQGR